MFVCKECAHPDDAWRFRMSVSYGPCEGCDKGAECIDAERLKPEPPSGAVGGMTETKTQYEQLAAAVAAEPEGATVVLDGAGNVTAIPPLSQDDSEYGRNMRELHADLEAQRGGIRWLSAPETDADNSAHPPLGDGMHIEVRPDGTEIWHPPLPEPKS